MNRIVAVLISLFIFALFCLYCVRTHAGMIEHDILARTTGEVLAGGSHADGLSVSGRDVYLSGAPGSPIVSEAMREKLLAVPGVRTVNVTVANAPLASAMDVSPDAKTLTLKTQSQQKLNETLQTRIVEFNSGSAELTRAGRDTLDAITPILAATPGLLCRINGYTDSRGDADQNLDLSQRRAIATKKYLESKGIEGSRLTAQGFGVANPIASNDSAEGRHKNRRIEFLLQEKN